MPSIEVRGADRIQRNAGRLSSRMLRILDPVTALWVRGMRQRLASRAYPPGRPGQTYVRTGTLRNSWSDRKRSDSEYSIINDASQRGRMYPIYVLGNGETGGGQAGVHRGRWWIAREKVEDELPTLTTPLTLGIVQEWER